MKRFLVPTLIGIVVAVFSFFLTVFSVGACHCVTPTTFFFPYAAIMLGVNNGDSIGLFFLAAQFPVYSIIVGSVRGSGRRVLVGLVLLAIHTVAVVIGLRVHRH
jgi:hypothetical protein